MTEGTSVRAGRTPWHLWLVGVVALLWNGYGAYDYTMTQTGGEAYLRQAAQGMGWDAAKTDAFIRFYETVPVWMTAAWAIGVWGGVAGAILLLVRRRWAVWAFAASLLGAIAGVVFHYTSGAGEIMGQEGTVMNAVILVGAVFFLWYAWTMAKRGVLR
jgi:hypothetical protein